MNESIQNISSPQLAFAFLPVVAVIAVLYRWSAGGSIALYAMARMLLQLLLVGYVLAFIFEAEHAAVVITVLSMMLLFAAWIALRPLRGKQSRLYYKALGAIALGGGLTLALVTQAVLRLEPWFAPRFMIPLAGMIFANAMNTISLAGERFFGEIERGTEFATARRTALNAALIPLVNSLFAVGLVSIPGMMTGQILSGVSPLIAARYQIVVMCMIFGSAGISAIVFLHWVEPQKDV